MDKFKELIKQYGADRVWNAVLCLLGEKDNDEQRMD